MKELTYPRRRALELISVGKVSWFANQWFQKGYWQPLNARPYNWALTHNLIEVQEKPTDVTQPSNVRLLPAGRDVLDGKVESP